RNVTGVQTCALPIYKGVARFRTRLFTAMMLVVATLTGLGFYLAQRKVTADAERNLQQIFQAELSSLHKLEELRHAALADRCNAQIGRASCRERSKHG